MFCPNPLGAFSAPAQHRLSFPFGRDSTTSGLAQYRINSNSLCLTPRNSFPCWKLTCCLKDWRNNSHFPCFFWNLWKPSHAPVEEIVKTNLFLTGPFSSCKSFAPCRKSPPSSSKQWESRSCDRNLGISSPFLMQISAKMNFYCLQIYFFPFKILFFSLSVSNVHLLVIGHVFS